MQYVDLQPFADFIRQRDLVDERHVSFYISWVLRFIRAGFDLKALSAQDLLLSFSEQLARDESLQDWQRRQAMKAVELYLNVFLPGQENGAMHGAESQAKTASTSSEQDALREMKNLLKLRHYSPRTLETYEGWVTRYFRYARIQSLEWISPDTVRAYLSHTNLKNI